MGIRFYCPNGHKLNVKTFQAGQKGICPVCGVKMQIPLESTRPSAHEDQSQPPGGPPVTQVSSDFDDDEPANLPSSPPVSVAGSADPLAAAGEVVWYVRPPSGGQFGPATAAIMRNWLVEGRVSPDALVWREGWRDWQDAAKVFPQLSSGQAIADLEDILSEPATVPGPIRPVKPLPPARNTQAIIVGVLLAIVFVVFALLLWYLSRQ